MSYIGNPVISTDFPVDYKSGNGSTTAFTLSIAPASVNAIDVEVSGVSQSPQTYSVSGTTLTFSAAPPSGSSNIVIKHRGTIGTPNTPSAASVVTSSIAANAVTPAKMANGGAEFSYRNRIINGAMVISQRGTSFTGNGYNLDRWSNSVSSPSSFTITQSSSAPSGFSNSLLFTVTTGGAVSSYLNYLRQGIEGYNIADLGWGTASAKAVTISFWVKSSITGTFGGSLRNSTATYYSYPFTYTINAANTWEQKSITIPGCTTGTWATDNTSGIDVFFDWGTTSTYTAASGSWQTGNYVGATGTQTSLVATNGSTWAFTGVQLEVGTTATNFEVRSYGTELALCQRYYCKSFDIGTAPADGVGAGMYSTIAAYTNSNSWTSWVSFPVTMRTSPTITGYRATGLGVTNGLWGYYSGGWASFSSQAFGINTTGFYCGGNTVGGFTTGAAYLVGGHYTASAEL